MLRQKSRELSWKLIARLDLKSITVGFDLINPCILKVLESVYIQARKDQVEKVLFSILEDGSVYFDNELNY